MAKGFTLSFGVDYEETFAPVAKLNSVRVILSLAANLDWPLHQLDIKNVFLNDGLEEDILGFFLYLYPYLVGRVFESIENPFFCICMNRYYYIPKFLPSTS